LQEARANEDGGHNDGVFSLDEESQRSVPQLIKGSSSSAKCARGGASEVRCARGEAAGRPCLLHSAPRVAFAPRVASACAGARLFIGASALWSQGKGRREARGKSDEWGGKIF